MSSFDQDDLDEPDTELNKLAGRVIGAGIEVHQDLGPGFLESIYEEAVGVELTRREIPYRRQVSTHVQYKNRPVGQARIDLIVDDRLLVELKAVDPVQPIHRATVMSYLKATGINLGLLLNFNSKLLKDGIERFVWSDDTDD